ncbi:hypothetical protein ACVISU_000546 [Bradyrhizobium sp. USDA 4452]
MLASRHSGAGETDRPAVLDNGKPTWPADQLKSRSLRSGRNCFISQSHCIVVGFFHKFRPSRHRNATSKIEGSWGSQRNAKSAEPRSLIPRDIISQAMARSVGTKMQSAISRVRSRTCICSADQLPFIGTASIHQKPRTQNSLVGRCTHPPSRSAAASSPLITSRGNNVLARPRNPGRLSGHAAISHTIRLRLDPAANNRSRSLKVRSGSQ